MLPAAVNRMLDVGVDVDSHPALLGDEILRHLVSMASELPHPSRSVVVAHLLISVAGRTHEAVGRGSSLIRAWRSEVRRSGRLGAGFSPHLPDSRSRRSSSSGVLSYTLELSMARVYLETSVISYLAALPSRDVVVAGHQQTTRDWWERRSRFELFVSDAVIEEAAREDGGAARRRLELLDAIPVLSVLGEAETLARSFLSEAALPSKAAIDAVHVALAAVHGMDFLVTWNCKHLEFCAGELATALR